VLEVQPVVGWANVRTNSVLEAVGVDNMVGDVNGIALDVVGSGVDVPFAQSLSARPALFL